MPPDKNNAAGQFPLDLSGYPGDNRFLAALDDLSARFDRAFLRIETMAEDITHLKRELRYRRRNLSAATKRRHIADIQALGSRCPCCSIEAVLDADGNRLQGSEYDHFFSSSYPGPEHTWLICKGCHAGFTFGRIARDQREAEFRAYQSKRRRLGGIDGVLL
jgi:hypothetical protein